MKRLRNFMRNIIRGDKGHVSAPDLVIDDYQRL